METTTNTKKDYSNKISFFIAKSGKAIVAYIKPEHMKHLVPDACIMLNEIPAEKRQEIVDRGKNAPTHCIEILPPRQR